ncbi:MAG: NADH-quinone oxidoreductase subunit C [Gammaproteobacteria bacterium]
MAEIEILSAKITERFPQLIERSHVAIGELTVEVKPEHLRELCLALRDEAEFDFKLLVDVCGVDYLHYGLSEWETTSATATGFERGVDRRAIENPHLTAPRFASVYHLLSLNQNHRIRLQVFLEHHDPKVPTVVDIWPAANWFEREAFDLYGIIYTGHPDLRRILTDYGFIGHPFRKDFPLSGNVEARYDAKLQRVVYEPVSIQPRILEPKVIRRDSRYQGEE